MATFTGRPYFRTVQAAQRDLSGAMDGTEMLAQGQILMEPAMDLPEFSETPLDTRRESWCEGTRVVLTKPRTVGGLACVAFVAWIVLERLEAVYGSNNSATNVSRVVCAVCGGMCRSRHPPKKASWTRACALCWRWTVHKSSNSYVHASESQAMTVQLALPSLVGLEKASKTADCVSIQQRAMLSDHDAEQCQPPP